ncbi:hypothetical protein LguiA_016782 [Lonicera macranthoides]
MVTGSKGDMVPNVNFPSNTNDSSIMRRPIGIGNLETSLESELESMLRMRRNPHIMDQERDLNMYRSGSAPPTVEGSLTAVGSLFRNPNFVQIDSNSASTNGVLTEEEIRSHPAYLSYYYSHDNHNPRLPPPLLSKEDWRVAQRFQVGIGERRKNNFVEDRSLFSMQPGLAVQKAEDELMELRNATARNISRKNSVEWMDRSSGGVIGVPGAGMGSRRKSFADILQEGLDQPASLSSRLSRPSSHNAFGDVMDNAGISVSHRPEVVNETEPTEALHHPRSDPPGFSRGQNLVSGVSHSFESAVGLSLSRSRTPEPHMPMRSSSPGLPPMGSRIFPVEKKNTAGTNALNGFSSSMNEISDVTASLSGLSLSNNHYDKDSLLQSQFQMRLVNHPTLPFDTSNGHRQRLQQQFIDKSISEKLAIGTNYIDLVHESRLVKDLTGPKLRFDGQVNFPRRTSSSTNLHSKSNSSGFASLEGSNIPFQIENFPGMDFSGHIATAGQKLKTSTNPNLDTAAVFDSIANGRNLSSSQAGSDIHSPVLDPRYIGYLQKISDYSIMHTEAFSGDSSRGRNYFGESHGHGDSQSLQKAYIETLLAKQKQQYELPLLGKSNHQYCGNPTFGIGIPYQGNAIANSVTPSLGSGSSMLQNDRNSRFTSTLRSSIGGGSNMSWHAETEINMKGSFALSLLEEIKNNKTRSFELSDIVDHVIEFSTDQYGSRFIQQKLETATVEEKTKIFSEIMPLAHSLMTDVFGNYVIQKFFEHGTESQRKELASQLIGHVLPLSLQMYGCRVIQKALEVVDVDQQTQMVAELDGSVMKCVRDQNGNHVIQKCIECVPQDQIQFIISTFFGQVVALSTHPYGCRVIQRVLEHCYDPRTQQIVMDEIMNAVCTLAQDQYGNYVIQHVLQHGKPHERSVIISKLAGQIVKMSQQKFASNVVEKCLTFGGPEERQLLVNEMLGSTDENEPLQAMMKDPFGNYVVQKVLETCDDQSRELIVSRIKVHLNALKRYTYGKHIVSRVEKLLTAGERQIALSSSSSS